MIPENYALERVDVSAQSKSSPFLVRAANEACASTSLTATASCSGLTLPDRVRFPTNYSVFGTSHTVATMARQA